MNTHLNIPHRYGDRWYFPDGRTLPVITGGDQTATVEDTLPADLKARLVKVRDFAAAAEEDGRDFTPEERAEAKQVIDEIANVKRQRDGAKRKDVTDQLEAILTPIDADEAGDINAKALAGAKVGIDPAAPTMKALGARFVESPEFKALIDRHPNGFGSKARVGMDPVMVGALKALIGSDAVDGMIQVDDRGYVAQPWGRDLLIRQAITVGQTSSDTVEYARQDSVVNNAAPVPESATDEPVEPPTIEAGYKPQSDLSFTKVVESVKTIAHWLAATKRALSDAGQLRTLIDSFLRFGLDEELENQIIGGDGTGEEFTGILNTTGVQAQAFDTSAIVTIRKAMTQVRVGGRARTTAVALHPADDEALDLAVDDNGRFFGNGPFALGPSVIWGRPRIVTEAVPEGLAIVGDWRMAVLWDREQAMVSVTDSHADFFIRNLVAVLAELRAAFGILRPAAFSVAELTP